MRYMYEGALIREYSDADMGIYENVPMNSELADSLLDQVSSTNTIQMFDWGVGDIIREELNSYYSQGKTAEEMADSLYSRLLLYAQENYG